MDTASPTSRIVTFAIVLSVVLSGGLALAYLSGYIYLRTYLSVFDASYLADLVPLHQLAFKGAGPLYAILMLGLGVIINWSSDIPSRHALTTMVKFLLPLAMVILFTGAIITAQHTVGNPLFIWLLGGVATTLLAVALGGYALVVYRCDKREHTRSMIATLAVVLCVLGLAPVEFGMFWGHMNRDRVFSQLPSVLTSSEPNRDLRAILYLDDRIYCVLDNEEYWSIVPVRWEDILEIRGRQSHNGD